ncbi:MAG: hypothetical protein IPK83_15280 [Planctomycetes bacterium]|nr:hypothetical protein [Planctomycetota bacterium]
MDPELSLGGYGLHFSSDRSMASDTKPDDRSHYDIYYSASREVFREVETQNASIDWAALWRSVGPNLLWALLALMLLALLAALMRDFKDRRLSLLARCLFASLMAHMLLMLLFNVWQVGTAVARAFNGHEKIQVSLVSAAVGEQIFSQVRGDFTDIEPLTPAVASIDRAEPEMNQPNLVEPIEPLSITSLDSPPTQIHDATKLEMQVVMDASLSKSAAERANENEPPSEALQVQMEFADIAAPAVDEREVASEAILKFRDEFPEVVLSPAKLEIATSQPVIERIDLAEMNEPPPTTSEVPTSLLTNLTDESLDAAISRALARQIESDSEPVEYVQIDQSMGGSDFAIPTAHEAENNAEEETPLAVPMAVASSQPLHADAGDLRETQVAAPLGRVEFEPTTAHGAVQMSPESLAASEVADSETSQIELGLFENSTEPVSGAAAPMAELALTLPGADATQSAHEAVESSIVLAPKAIQGQHVNLGMAEADPTKVEPIAVARFEPAKSNRSDGEPMKLPEATPGDAKFAALTGQNTSSKIAAIESDLPALDLALPAENSDILPPDAIGIIRGRILDAESLKPLANGLVRLVMPDDRTIEAPSDDAGVYSLYVPPTPDFFALTASRGGYLPKSTNIRAGNLSQTPMNVDFELQRQSDPLIALEEKPDVHHLGNDLFEGRINSKFQREAEGRTFISLFNVSREQLDADYSRAEIHLLARGVQCVHPIRINGRLLRRRLDASPSDGSFGEFVAEFDPHWLIEGENSFKIRAQSCRGDLDDFEFVNIQIRFLP